MTMNRFGAGPFLFAFSVVVSFGAETSERVDFRRDVQPLIEKNCIVCHGPEQQMNGFRLDRRSSALRGGTRSVLVPGNSAASRLYLRLIGNQFGKQMPTTGALSAKEISVFKTWIDQGAVWPDDLANELVLTPPDPDAVQVSRALRNGDRELVLKLIGEHPECLNARGPDGSSPLMFAVLYADSGLVEKLLDLGADPNRKNDAQATALMWAANHFDKTKALLQHGADVNVMSVEGRTPLLIASGVAGNSAIVKLLLDHGANPNPKGRPPGNASPLREAAGAGDVVTMQALIAKGANVRAAGAGALSGALEAKCYPCVDLLAKTLDSRAYTSALLSLAVYSDLDAMKFLVDHGANINAADSDGRTALMYAANNDRLPLEIVKLLIDNGADVNARNYEGFSALDAARLHGETPIVALLTRAGAKSEVPVAKPVDWRGSNTTIALAVNRALPLLQKADLSFTRKSGCVSCHNEALTNMAVATARKNGFRIDEPMARLELGAVTSFFNEWRERLLEGVAPGGPAYTLQGLHAERYPADMLTDSIARYIKMHQFTDGHWGPGCGGSRNPLCGDPITNTANSLRALQLYAPATSRAEYEAAIDKAASWLTAAAVYTNEDRTFRLFGLVWAGKSAQETQKAMEELLRTQRKDGGWSDNPYMASTAYATGEAMVALHEAGLPLGDPAWRKGVTFLLRDQREDGSWFVKSHSYGTQPYFDNGFPHGLDQWISAAATNWATMALALSSGSNGKLSSSLP